MKQYKIAKHPWQSGLKKNKEDGTSPQSAQLDVLMWVWLTLMIFFRKKIWEHISEVWSFLLLVHQSAPAAALLRGFVVVIQRPRTLKAEMWGFWQRILATQSSSKRAQAQSGAGDG